MGNLTPQELAALIPRPLPSHPKIKALAEQVLNQGYVIIPNCFSRAEGREAIEEIKRLSGKDPKTSRDDFFGRKTSRIYALPNKSRVFDKFYMLPEVLALNDYFLDPDYLFYVIQSIVINPGEKQQPIHHDDAVAHLPRPRAPLTAAIMAVLEDYTATNGATTIIPGSHLWGPGQTFKQQDAISAICPAGSIIYFLGITYHGGGANISNQPRHALTVQYGQPWLRPLEDLMLSVDPRKLNEIPEKVVDMMGYKSGYPYLGSVDGMNPRKGMQRMMRWLRSPVDYNTPTFAMEEGHKEHVESREDRVKEYSKL
ncbi:phytanoyl-CoA dioxygenase [Xylogone sp. PMI_703]|nr:phytanoyl-CoA dioxygenase [Xylogone sp. PMI_703]